MSVTIITIDGTGDNLYMVTDKRQVKEIDHSFVTDDIVKITPIRHNLIYSGSSYSRVPDKIIPIIDQVKNYPASKIIKIIKEWDKRFNRLSGKIDHLNIQLSGVYDDGRLFIYSSGPEGKDEIRFNEPGIIVGTLIAVEDDITKIGCDLMSRIAPKANNLLEAMIATVNELSKVTQLISPTYNYFKIHREK